MKSQRFQWLLLLATAVVIAFSTGCDKKEDKEEVKGSEVLSGKVTDKKELKANVEYTLDGSLIVEAGGELTIPAGTVVKAKPGFSSYILVARGGKIYINGTADKPVKLIPDDANAKGGYWGGLIINGYAPLTSGQKEFNTEINVQYPYGGDKKDDNSGVVTYLIIDGAGAQSNDNVEHNGLTLNGVGSGTKIENVYVLNSADDGIEFFGGCVNVTNLLVVNSDDDMFDFTQGYKGTLKNCYGRWEKGYTSTEKDPRGVEVDGNHDGEHQDDLEQSNFTIENMTIELLCDYVMQDAMKIRRGAMVAVKNALVKGGKVDNCVDLSDKMGDAEKVTISYTLDGTTCIKDEVVLGGVPAEKADIKNVKGNTGCPQNLFGWTGYKF